MNLDHYETEANTALTIATFTSTGPKGPIAKLLQLYPIDLVAAGIDPGPTRSRTHRDDVFNLGFGDHDPVTDQVSDSIASNNGDRDKVLATVAGVACEFCYRYPAYWVFAQGSTAARTRLYQMGLNRFYADLVDAFRLFGYLSGKWVAFEQNVNYDAFLIRLK